MRKEYEILGVDQYATREEITQAYRRAAMRWHPDRNPGNPEATERFQEISRAYRLLIKLAPRARPAAGTAAPPPDFTSAMDAAMARRRAQAREQMRAQKQAEAEARRGAGKKWVKMMRAARKRAAAREAKKRREEAGDEMTSSSPWFSLCLTLVGVACFIALSFPLDILALSALLLLALAWLPRGKTYTDMALSAGIDCYFLVLAAWVVWRLVERL